MPKASRDNLNNKGKKDAYTFDPEDLVLVEDPKHPLYDKRVHLPVSESLVLNMMHAPDGVPQGVLEPITVARDPDSNKILVVIGRQRVKAAREANKRLRKAGLEPFWVPAIMSARHMKPHRALGMIISENEGRQDDTPLGRAEKAKQYLELGRDETEVAVLFGVSAAAVKNWVALLEAPAVVRNAVEAGKISISDGYKLAKLDPAEAKAKVDELLEHAPRTPGKKRNSNAKKAREIVNGGKEKDKEPKISKRGEDAVATDIAAWIDENYQIMDAFPDMLKLIRSGKWREIRGE